MRNLLLNSTPVKFISAFSVRLDLDLFSWGLGVHTSDFYCLVKVGGLSVTYNKWWHGNIVDGKYRTNPLLTALYDEKRRANGTKK